MGFFDEIDGRIGEDQVVVEIVGGEPFGELRLLFRGRLLHF